MRARTRATTAVTLMAAALGAAGPATAATAPTVATGGAARVTDTTATLTGSVNPQGSATTYFFQYGPTTRYGAQTPTASAGAGSRTVSVVADIAGLTPDTTYHFRLVAHNAGGTRRGTDRTFTTLRQPLRLALDALPNPITFGTSTVPSGVLSGTGNAGRQVVLQQRAFPYTDAFMTVGGPATTDAAGRFLFPAMALPQNTQLRARTTTTSPIRTSPVITVGVAVRITTRLSATRVHRGRLVRFSGTIAPARDGAQFAVQRLRSDGWATVAGGITHHAAGGVSTYAKRIRAGRTGLYRVYVRIVDGNLVSGAGLTKHLRVLR